MINTEMPATERRSLGTKLLRFMQWIMFAFTLLLALGQLIHFEHRGLPGFPEVGFWIMLATGLLLALWHLPKVFFGLSRWWKIGGYVAILPVLAISGQVGNQSFAAYHRTPEGAAAKAKQDRQDELDAAAEKRREAVAQAKAEKDARGQKAAERAERDDWLSRNPELITPQNWSCTNLIPSVIQMSQSRPIQVLEITSPREETHVPGFNITCNARAEWTDGATFIHYGARLSEGGQIIVTFSQNP